MAIATLTPIAVSCEPAPPIAIPSGKLCSAIAMSIMSPALNIRPLSSPPSSAAIVASAFEPMCLTFKRPMSADNIPVTAAPAMSAPKVALPIHLPKPEKHSIASGSISSRDMPSMTPAANESTPDVTRSPLSANSAPSAPPIPVPATPADSDKTRVKLTESIQKIYAAFALPKHDEF